MIISRSKTPTIDTITSVQINPFKSHHHYSFLSYYMWCSNRSNAGRLRSSLPRSMYNNFRFVAATTMFQAEPSIRSSNLENTPLDRDPSPPGIPRRDLLDGLTTNFPANGQPISVCCCSLYSPFPGGTSPSASIVNQPCGDLPRELSLLLILTRRRHTTRILAGRRRRHLMPYQNPFLSAT